MYNWNINTTTLKKNLKKYAIWKLEQQINFRLNGKKLKMADVKKYWTKLTIDPQRRKLLEMWLWSKQS